MKKILAGLVLFTGMTAQAHPIFDATAVTLSSPAYLACVLLDRQGDEWCVVDSVMMTVSGPTVTLQKLGITVSFDKELVIAANDSAAEFLVANGNSEMNAELSSALENLKENPAAKDLSDLQLAQMIIELNAL